MHGVCQGRYVFKLLAVDVPSAAGPEQRIYLEGDERIYNRGSVMRELRDPFLNVRTQYLLILECGSFTNSAFAVGSITYSASRTG